MQLDSLSLQVLSDVLHRFEGFCQKKGALDAHTPFPSLLVVDHVLPLSLHQKRAVEGDVWVVAPTGALLTPYLTQGAIGALMKETMPAFTACFQTIIVCFLSPPSLDADVVLKQWAGCLMPQGKLYFLMPGEMTLCEWAAVEGFASLHSPHDGFLSRCALNWMGDCQVQTEEIWVRLRTPSLGTTTTLSQLILKEREPPLLTTLLASSSFPNLTLHFVYGEMRKIEKSQDV